MKKLIVVILCVMSTIAVFPIQAKADVIYEPDNEFYESHKDDCIYIGRNYWVNGQFGRGSYYKRPSSNVSKDSKANGEIVFISFQYSANNESYGLIEADNTWMNMNDLSLVYDCQQFLDEHSDKLEQYDGQLENYVAKEYICTYSYPGSGDGSPGFESFGETYVNTTFTDEDGLVWAYFSYYYGYRDFWVCISDPENQNLADKHLDKTVIIPSTDEAEYERLLKENGITHKSETGITIAIVGAVMSVVVVTAVLTIVFMSKKKKK